GSLIPMNGYSYTTVEHDDWGCSFTQYFSADSAGEFGVDKVSKTALRLYPNPAREKINLDLGQEFNAPYTIHLVNLQGKTVYQTTADRQHIQIPVRQMASGLYMLI